MLHFDSGNKSFSAEEIEQYKSEFNLDEQELKRIYRRFKKLDTDKVGQISIEEFQSQPDLAANPLLERVLSVLDKNHDHLVDLKDFVKGISIFSPKSSREEKMRCK